MFFLNFFTLYTHTKKIVICFELEKDMIFLTWIIIILYYYFEINIVLGSEKSTFQEKLFVIFSNTRYKDENISKTPLSLL